MEKIGLFYGSDTGNTEEVAEKIQEILGEDRIDLYDMYEAKKEQFDQYEKLIFGLSTWHDGQLQSDWETYFEEFKSIDFTGKTIAFFGLGDQYVYAEYFIDGIGTIAEVVIENGGNIIGKWPSKGYDHTESKAEMEEGLFIGLALDQDNQPEETDDRLDTWIEQIKEEFPIK